MSARRQVQAVKSKKRRHPVQVLPVAGDAGGGVAAGHVAPFGPAHDPLQVLGRQPQRVPGGRKQVPEILEAQHRQGDYPVALQQPLRFLSYGILRASPDLVHGAGTDLFEAIKILRAANPQRYSPQNGAAYPNTEFGQRLRQIAQLIKAGVGLEVAFADVGGWDTHVNQGGATGKLASRLDDFARSIAAFVTDLGDRMEDVLILTMSEFGRTARQNGTGGTDHGHAGSMFVIGGSVNGHRVHGRWPGLEPEQLNEGRDLALTTDFRALFSEVASKHLGAERSDALFPGYNGSKLDWPGVL